MKNQKTIELTESWFKRLQVYMDAVIETSEDDMKNRLAIISLLGYLYSLKFIYEAQRKRKNK